MVVENSQASGRRDSARPSRRTPAAIVFSIAASAAMVSSSGCAGADADIDAAPDATDAEAPAPSTGGAGRPNLVRIACNPNAAVQRKIDGLLTPQSPGACPEYSWQVGGLYGDFFVEFDGYYLSVLNLWYLKDDEPTDPNCYNLFQITTAGGLQSWEIKVFGDSRITIFLNGDLMDMDDASGAAHFGLSPGRKTPHASYEFRVPVLPGDMTTLPSDPKPGFFTTCEESLVREPTVLRASLTEGGGLHPALDAIPTLLAIEPSSARPAEVVHVVAENLPEKPGQVFFGTTPALVAAWAEDGIDVVVPYLAGDALLRAELGFESTNELAFTLGCTPGCKGRACGMDDCSASCGTCEPGETCAGGVCR